MLHLAGADAEGERAERAVGEVCESPQTMVRPGWVNPSCGPMTCTMPWSASPMDEPDAELGAVAAQGLHLGARGQVRDRTRDGRDVVVLGGDGEVKAGGSSARTAGGRRRPAGW